MRKWLFTKLFTKDNANSFLFTQTIFLETTKMKKKIEKDGSVFYIKIKPTIIKQPYNLFKYSIEVETSLAAIQVWQPFSHSTSSK